MLKLTDVTISYGKKIVLQNINFTVGKGEWVAITGRNGVGKSSLLKAMSGVYPINKGTVTYEGVAVNKAHAQKNIGYVPQDNIIFDDFTVADNLKFWSSANGMRFNAKKNENPIVNMLGFKSMMSEKAGNLSGGTKRRLSIACSIMHNPHILILDEPFYGIDIYIKHQLIYYFKQLREMGKAMVITSHNPAELSELCKTFYSINNKTVTPASFEEIYNFNGHTDNNIFDE